MNKYVLLLLISAAAIIYNIFFAEPAKTATLRVGVECDHLPYNWEETSPTETNFPLKNASGLYAEGYDIQMAALAAEEIGANIEFYKIHFDSLIDALNNNEIDAIFSGMVDTAERKKLINFTIPYEERRVEYGLLVQKNSPYAEAGSLSDLSGARIAAQTSSRFDEVIDQIPGVRHLPPLETQAEIVKALLASEIDATVLNVDTAQSYARRNKTLAAVKFPEGKGFDLGFTGLCAGVRKSDKKLLSGINEAIEKIPLRQRQRIMDMSVIRAGDKL